MLISQLVGSWDRVIVGNLKPHLAQKYLTLRSNGVNNTGKVTYLNAYIKGRYPSTLPYMAMCIETSLPVWAKLKSITECGDEFQVTLVINNDMKAGI